ncbi:MAG: PilT protein domain protein [Bryobacterales bacterium]|nr:PilT protein domain protein [Bryobacterales bacterium]
MFRRADEIAVPVIVLGEYRYGIQGSALLPDCRVLPLDEETAQQYADIRVGLKRRGRPIPANDLWIAALARQYKLPLLSRDVHFDIVPGLQRVGS